MEGVLRKLCLLSPRSLPPCPCLGSRLRENSSKLRLKKIQHAATGTGVCTIQDSPKRGQPTLQEGRQHTILHKFLKNYMKSRKFWSAQWKVSLVCGKCLIRLQLMYLMHQIDQFETLDFSYSWKVFFHNSSNWQIYDYANRFVSFGETIYDFITSYNLVIRNWQSNFLKLVQLAKSDKTSGTPIPETSDCLRQS